MHHVQCKLLQNASCHSMQQMHVESRWQWPKHKRPTVGLTVRPFLLSSQLPRWDVPGTTLVPLWPSPTSMLSHLQPTSIGTAGLSTAMHSVSLLCLCIQQASTTQGHIRHIHMPHPYMQANCHICGSMLCPMPLSMASYTLITASSSLVTPYVILVNHSQFSMHWLVKLCASKYNNCTILIITSACHVAISVHQYSH